MEEVRNIKEAKEMFYTYGDIAIKCVDETTGSWKIVRSLEEAKDFFKTKEIMDKRQEQLDLQMLGESIKNELREIGLIKQEEKLKITKNTKGYNYEYSLLGKVEEQILRVESINAELNRRLVNGQ